jgi:DNA-binding MarR family transcriptional regulator
VALLQAHASVVEAVGRALERERGLPLAWYEVLARLAASREGAIRMQDLARAAFLSKSGLTRLVDRMEAAGLLYRRACTWDRRGTYAALTPLGRQALHRAAPVFHGALERHFVRHLSPVEAGRLVEALRRVIEGNGWALLPECHAAEAPPAPAGRAGAARLGFRPA